MILETDVDDTQCSEQIVDVPVPQIGDRIVQVVTALHESESQNEPTHRSSKIVSRSRKLSGGEAVQDHQEDRAEKESDHP